MAEVSEHPLQALGETTLRNLDELGNPGFDRKKKNMYQLEAHKAVAEVSKIGNP